MADSPLIPKPLKDYILAFKLEETVSAAVNKVAREMPSDPYNFLAGFFANLSEEGPSLVAIRARELLLDIGPTLEVQVEGSSKGQANTAPPFIFSPGMRESEYTLDAERLNGRGVYSAVQQTGEFGPSLARLELTNQRKIDSIINEWEAGINVKVAVSFACALAGSYFTRIPLYAHVFEKFTRRNWEPSDLPKILMPVFYAGKSNGSKVKFSGFYLYEADPNRFDPFTQYENYKKLYETCRRLLASGKAGEAGLKPVGSGFIPSGDTILDTLKVLEDIVTQSGFVLNEDFRVGIDCNAEEFYNRDTAKYDMEGHKAPPDGVQLAEFYVKLATDKPYIGLFEDPFVSEDREAWNSLIEKASSFKVVAKRVASTPEEIKALAEPGEEAQPVVPHLVSINYTRLLTEIVDIGKEGSRYNMGIIISENLAESIDTSLVDLAVGLKAEFLQMGAPVKPGALSKFNRFMQIRNEL